jgi:hypothetical protein
LTAKEAEVAKQTTQQKKYLLHWQHLLAWFLGSFSNWKEQCTVIFIVVVS